MKDILLLTPPFTQLNTPYPATAYLKGFLNTKDITSFQIDLGIEVILELFSEHSLRELFNVAFENNRIISENTERIYALREDYFKSIDTVILFLQGQNPTFARQICTDNFLPEASRFEQLDDMKYAFGEMGMQDKAKHLATLFLEDLSDFIIECVDSNFGFSRYAEKLGQSANSFDALYEELHLPPSYIDTITLDILENHIQHVKPKMICISVPFPGNLYSAFKCAQHIKSNHHQIKVTMGGGFPNTELRSVKDVRVFEFFDCITLDDGEVPIELLYQQLLNENITDLKRTFHLKDGTAYYNNQSSQPDYKQSQLGTPDYSDLILDQYISVIEITNPMHSLWSDGRWNKLTMAHGCYWGKCTFCDISLDYIKIYEPIAAKLLVDRMEEQIAQTGTNGFHFVDEAAPPALMKALSLEIIKRKLSVTWWTNIRFEKNFTQDLCYLLKVSGCIAVSGGLEVASDRLLKLIDKGVTVEQVAQVTRNFTEANIMVHSYLMYGYPTQTIQETIDSLEMVRQLFEQKIIQSGFWHQFALTAHSPVGQNPDAYGIVPHSTDIQFANNDIDFTDNTGIDHSSFSFGLKKSLFNYMHGIGFEEPLYKWFDFEIPKTTIKKQFIAECLLITNYKTPKTSSQIVWLGSNPLVNELEDRINGKTTILMELLIHQPSKAEAITLDFARGEWLAHIIPQLSPSEGEKITYGELKEDFEEYFKDFDRFWNGEPMQILRSIGLIVL